MALKLTDPTLAGYTDVELAHFVVVTVAPSPETYVLHRLAEATLAASDLLEEASAALDYAEFRDDDDDDDDCVRQTGAGR